MWGNQKYYGAVVPSPLLTPIQIKDLETFKIVKLFCSQTYAFAITDQGEIRRWGLWLHELAKEELAEFGEDENAEDEDKNENEAATGFNNFEGDFDDGTYESDDIESD